MKRMYAKIFIVIIILLLALVHPTQAWEVSYELIWSYETDKTVFEILISSNGDYIAINGWDTVYFFNREGKLLWKYKVDTFIRSLSISSDGNYIAFGSGRFSQVSGPSKIYLFNRNGILLWSYEPDGDVLSVSISADGNYMVVGQGAPPKLYLFNKKGELLCSRQDGYPSELSISSNGNYIAAIIHELTSTALCLFNKDGNLVWSYKDERYEGPCFTPSISSDGNYIAAGGNDKVYFFNQNGKLLWSYETHEYTGTYISSDGNYVIATTGERVYFFNKDGKLLWSYGGENNWDVSLSSDGSYIIVGKHVFNKDGKLLWEYKTDTIVESVSISADGSYVAVGTNNKLYYFVRLLPQAAAEDSFNYQGEYTLDQTKLREEEKKVIPYVMKYAKEYKVSPCLIMAVIRQESKFFDYSQYPDKDPDKFDIGYMQVSYKASIDKYKKYTGDEYKGTEEEWQRDGLDPDTNIKYGTRYLRIQYERIKDGHFKDVYNDLLKSTLSAYNAGHPTKDNSKYVNEVIQGRDLIDDKRRGYEFFLTIRVPVSGVPASEKGIPGFEVIFAIAGLLAVTYPLRKRG